MMNCYKRLRKFRNSTDSLLTLYNNAIVSVIQGQSSVDIIAIYIGLAWMVVSQTSTNAETCRLREISNLIFKKSKERFSVVLF